MLLTSQEESMVKEKTSKLKKSLWQIFSRYIRHRDNWTCITCGKYATGAGMHAGHYIPKSVGGIELYFDEENVHAQCLTNDSKLLLENGKYTPIANIKVGTRLIAFDDTTGVKKVATVESVMSFLPKELFRVETENNKVFYATSDHQVLTTRGWKTIAQLLHNVSDHDIIEP